MPLVAHTSSLLCLAPRTCVLLPDIENRPCLKPLHPAAANSRKSALALLKWSWKKARPDFFGCRYAERNQWKIRGQPQCTLWLWPAAVTTAAVVCHEFPLLCFPAAHSRCGGFSAPTLLTLGRQHGQQNHPGSSPAASDCWLPLGNSTLLRKNIPSNDRQSKGQQTARIFLRHGDSVKGKFFHF